MAYLLDSDRLIDRLIDVPEAVALIARLAPAGLNMSVISYLEAFQGTLRDPDPAASQAKLDQLLRTIPVLPVSLEVARRCARLRETLRGRGRRVTPRTLDLIIAATAIEHDLILVTRNRRDYLDVPGLALYESVP